MSQEGQLWLSQEFSSAIMLLSPLAHCTHTHPHAHSHSIRSSFLTLPLSLPHKYTPYPIVFSPPPPATETSSSTTVRESPWGLSPPFSSFSTCLANLCQRWVESGHVTYPLYTHTHTHTHYTQLSLSTHTHTLHPATTFCTHTNHLTYIHLFPDPNFLLLLVCAWERARPGNDITTYTHT